MLHTSLGPPVRLVAVRIPLRLSLHPNNRIRHACKLRTERNMVTELQALNEIPKRSRRIESGLSRMILFPGPPIREVH